MGSSTKKQTKTKKEEPPPTTAALSDQFQLLRSLTNSSAMNKTSIIVDAAKYIAELKDKVERLSQEASSSSPQPAVVTVETLEKPGYLINVVSEKSSPGLLVAILEAFHDLGLEVLDATVSCSDSFQLQAVGTGQNMDEEEDTMDAQMVKQAVQQAIQIWSETDDGC